MRTGLIVLSAALLLAAVAGQNGLLRPQDAESANPAITACAVQGASCPQPSLDGTPGLVLEHSVLVGGCAQMDLHVVRYVPTDSNDGTPVVATWCT